MMKKLGSWKKMTEKENKKYTCYAIIMYVVVCVGCALVVFGI